VRPHPCLRTAQARPRRSVEGVGGARNGTVGDAQCVSARRPLPGTMGRKRSSVQAKSQGSATNHNASYKHTHPDGQNPLHPWSGLMMGAFTTVRSARGWNDCPRSGHHVSRGTRPELDAPCDGDPVAPGATVDVNHSPGRCRGSTCGSDTSSRSSPSKRRVVDSPASDDRPASAMWVATSVYDDAHRRAWLGASAAWSAEEGASPTGRPFV